MAECTARRWGTVRCATGVDEDYAMRAPLAAARNNRWWQQRTACAMLFADEEREQQSTLFARPTHMPVHIHTRSSNHHQQPGRCSSCCRVPPGQAATSTCVEQPQQPAQPRGSSLEPVVAGRRDKNPRGGVRRALSSSSLFQLKIQRGRKRGSSVLRGT